MPTACRSVLKLTEGQAHDGRSAADMLGSLGPGHILLADRAYDSNALRETLKQRGLQPVTPCSARALQTSLRWL